MIKKKFSADYFSGNFVLHFMKVSQSFLTLTPLIIVKYLFPPGYYPSVAKPFKVCTFWESGFWQQSGTCDGWDVFGSAENLPLSFSMAVCIETALSVAIGRSRTPYF